MSVLPARATFTAWRGGTWRKQFTLYEGEDPTPGTERDLTGYSAELVVLSNENEELLRLTDEVGEFGQIILGGTAGTITLLIPDDVTAGISWQTGKFQLLITTPTGDTDPILWGHFAVKGL